MTAQAQELLEKQREDYETQREAIAKQHQEHLETMRKQNELGAGIGSVRTDFAIDVSLGLRELMFELTFLE